MDPLPEKQVKFTITIPAASMQLLTYLAELCLDQTPAEAIEAQLGPLNAKVKQHGVKAK